jgi:hypothetical protein
MLSQISKRVQAIVALNDSVEDELDKTFNLPEENDSCIVIGSPPHITKSDLSVI